MSELTRTVIVKSTPLSKRVFRVFGEHEAMYRNIIGQLVVHAIENDVRSFVKLKASRYRSQRVLPELTISLCLHSMPRRLYKG